MSGSEGIIDLDTDLGKELGFTSDKFCGYLSLVDGYIYISFIESLKPNCGNLSQLFDTILSKGYGIKVPSPMAKMRAICVKKGFKETEEDDVDLGTCHVWVKEVSES